MQNRPAPSAAPVAVGAFGRLLSTDGTAAHPFVLQLVAPRPNPRDLGDVVHALCTVHGHRPDLLTLIADLAPEPIARAWLKEAAAGFAAERAALAQLVTAAGPLPSTPGQAETAAVLTAERHTLEMLARSERTGVALGAAAALVGDWPAIRGVLVRAADRFGVELPAPALPDPEALLDATAAPERAIGFGAQQLLAQHRGLWSLLEARASARAAQ